MKKILLPTDFSENSINAIEYATELFKDIPCKFYVLNVFKIPYLANEELMEHNATQLAALEEEMYDHSIEEMNRLLEKIPENPKHNYEGENNYFLNNESSILTNNEI